MVAEKNERLEVTSGNDHENSAPKPARLEPCPLADELEALRQAIVPLQGEVSRDRGYRFTVSRANLELAMKGRR